MEMFNELSFFVDLIQSTIKTNDIVEITKNLNETFGTNYSHDEVRNSIMEINLDKHNKEVNQTLCLNNLFKEYYE